MPSARLTAREGHNVTSAEFPALLEEFEESEDDEDPNKPGPVEAYAFRACGKACGTCE